MINQMTKRSKSNQINSPEKVFEKLAASGGMHVQNDFCYVLFQTQRKGFAGGHSNRQTTAEALGSLPPPTETAQVSS